MVSWIGLIFGILVALGVIAWFKDWWLAKWRIRWGPPAPGTHFTILVAQLDNDADNSQQKHIRQSLEAQFRGAGADARMHIDIYPDTLRLKTGEIGAALLDAEKKGRDWLWQRNADILIWGEVADANKLLRLRFTTADAATDSAKPYSLTEIQELPANFGADFGAVLATLAATGIQPIYEEAGRRLPRSSSRSSASCVRSPQTRPPISPMTTKPGFGTLTPLASSSSGKNAATMPGLQPRSASIAKS